MSACVNIEDLKRGDTVWAWWETCAIWHEATISGQSLKHGISTWYVSFVNSEKVWGQIKGNWVERHHIRTMEEHAAIVLAT